MAMLFLVMQGNCFSHGGTEPRRWVNEVWFPQCLCGSVRVISFPLLTEYLQLLSSRQGLKESFEISCPRAGILSVTWRLAANSFKSVKARGM